MHGNRAIFPLGLLPLGLMVLDAFFTFCCAEDLGEGFGCVDFCMLIQIVSETATVSFRTLPVGFPLPTISLTSLFTLFPPLILDHGACFKISISGFKVPHSQILFDTSFYHCLQSVIIRSSFLLMISRSYNSNKVLSFSDSRILNLYKFSKMSSGGIFVIDNKMSRTPEYHHLEEQ